MRKRNLLAGWMGLVMLFTTLTALPITVAAEITTETLLADTVAQKTFDFTQSPTNYDWKYWGASTVPSITEADGLIVSSTSTQNYVAYDTASASGAYGSYYHFNKGAVAHLKLTRTDDHGLQTTDGKTPEARLVLWGGGVQRCIKIFPNKITMDGAANTTETDRTVTASSAEFLGFTKGESMELIVKSLGDRTVSHTTASGTEAFTYSNSVTVYGKTESGSWQELFTTEGAATSGTYTAPRIDLAAQKGATYSAEFLRIYEATTSTNALLANTKLLQDFPFQAEESLFDGSFQNSATASDDLSNGLHVESQITSQTDNTTVSSKYMLSQSYGTDYHFEEGAVAHFKITRRDNYGDSWLAGPVGGQWPVKPEARLFLWGDGYQRCLKIFPTQFTMEGAANTTETGRNATASSASFTGFTKDQPLEILMKNVGTLTRTYGGTEYTYDNCITVYGKEDGGTWQELLTCEGRKADSFTGARIDFEAQKGAAFDVEFLTLYEAGLTTEKLLTGTEEMQFLNFKETAGLCGGSFTNTTTGSAASESGMNLISTSSASVEYRKTMSYGTDYHFTEGDVMHLKLTRTDEISGNSPNIIVTLNGDGSANGIRNRIEIYPHRIYYKQKSGSMEMVTRQDNTGVNFHLFENGTATEILLKHVGTRTLNNVTYDHCVQIYTKSGDGIWTDWGISNGSQAVADTNMLKITASAGAAATIDFFRLYKPKNLLPTTVTTLAQDGKYVGDYFGEGGLTATTSISDVKEEMTISLYMALYQNNQLILADVDKKTFSVGQKGDLSCTLDVKEKHLADAEVKVFLWNGMTPLQDTISLTTLSEATTTEELLRFYPGWTQKMATFDFDDGYTDTRTTDEDLINLFKKYGARATFNLMTDQYKGQEALTAKIKALYDMNQGMEVANHTSAHLHFVDDCNSDADAYTAQIGEGKDFLEDLFGYDIKGFVYPYYNPANETVYQYLKEEGFLYGRNNRGDDSFVPETDFLNWTQTSRRPYGHTDGSKSYATLAGEYVNLDTQGELTEFSLWAHSYSDFKVNGVNDWSAIEDTLEILKTENIWYATNVEYVEYLNAIRGLETTENSVTNPSSHVTVYLLINRRPITLAPGETYTVSAQ